MSFNINSSSFIPKKTTTTTTTTTPSTTTTTAAPAPAPAAPATTTTTSSTNFTMNFTIFRPKTSSNSTTTTATPAATTTEAAAPKAAEAEKTKPAEEAAKPAEVTPKPAPAAPPAKKVLDPEEEARKKEERKKRQKAKKAERKQQQKAGTKTAEPEPEPEPEPEEAEEAAEPEDDDAGFTVVGKGKKNRPPKQPKQQPKQEKKEPAAAKGPAEKGKKKEAAAESKKKDEKKEKEPAAAAPKAAAAEEPKKKEAAAEPKKKEEAAAAAAAPKAAAAAAEEGSAKPAILIVKPDAAKQHGEEKGEKGEKPEKKKGEKPERGEKKKKKGEKGGMWRKGAGAAAAESEEDYSKLPVGNLGEELSEEIAKALEFMKTLREYSDIDPISAEVTMKLDKMFQKKTARKLREARKNKRKMAKKRVKPLDVTENRWKRPADVSEREKTLQTVRLTLNKMVPSNFEELSKTIADIKIDSIDILSEVISLIFVKATLEPKWANMYANVCKLLHAAIKVPEGLETPEGKKVTFKGLILSNCQREFEENKGRVATVIPDDVSAEERELLENKKIKGHNMFIGNIIFIGELYNVRMLGSNVMFYCLAKLTENTKNPTEEDLEALVQLLKRVGKELDAKAENAVKLDRYFAKIRAYTELPNDVLALRVKVYLMNLLDLRRDKWVPRNPAADVALHKIVPTRVPSTPLHPFSPDLSYMGSSAGGGSRSGAVAQRSTSRHSRAPAAVAARRNAEAAAAAAAGPLSRSVSDCKTIPSKSGLNIRRLRDPKSMLASSTSAASSFEDIIDNATPSLTPALSQSTAEARTLSPSATAPVVAAPVVVHGEDEDEEDDGPKLVAVAPHRVPAAAAAAAAAVPAVPSPIRSAQGGVMLSASPAPQSRLTKMEITEEIMDATRNITGNIFEELVETKNVDEECLGFREEVNPSLMYIAIATMLEKCCLDTPRPVEAAELVGKLIYLLFTDEFITRRDVQKGLSEFLTMSLEDVLPDAPLLDEILASVAKELIAGDTLTFSLFFELVKRLAERSVPWKRNPGGLADALTLLTLKKLVADKGADKIAAKLADSDTCISDIFILAESAEQKLALTQALLRDAGLLHAYPAVEAGTVLADLATYAADPAKFADAPEALVKDCVLVPMLIHAAIEEAGKLGAPEAFLDALTKKWRPVFARVYEVTTAKVNRFYLFSELAYAFGELGSPKGLFNAVISEYKLNGYVPEWANLATSVNNKSAVLNDIPKPSNRN